MDSWCFLYNTVWHISWIFIADPKCIALRIYLPWAATFIDIVGHANHPSFRIWFYSRPYSTKCSSGHCRCSRLLTISPRRFTSARHLLYMRYIFSTNSRHTHGPESNGMDSLCLHSTLPRNKLPSVKSPPRDYPSNTLLVYGTFGPCSVLLSRFQRNPVANFILEPPSEF